MDSDYIKNLTQRIEAHIRQLAPHAKNRDGATLLKETVHVMIFAVEQKHRADVLAATILALRGVVTIDAETKEDFTSRVRKILSDDPDDRLSTKLASNL